MTRRVIAALWFIAVFVITGDLPAKPFEVGDQEWEGLSELYQIARNELGASNVETVGVLDWGDIEPEDGVLVLHPEKPLNASDATAFMKAGGRLAILDDYGRGEDLLSRFRIERIPAPTRPMQALRNNPNLAIAEPVTEQVAGKEWGPHPVVSNVKQLVTNHPTGMTHPQLSPVLQIRAAGNDQDVVVAVAGQVEKGRLFAMSDPSAVINLMLRYPGNRAFVGGLVRYLVKDGQDRGQGRLFIVANDFDEEGGFGGQTSLGRDLSNALEGLNDWLAEAKRDGLPGWVHLLMAAALALAVAYWVSRNSAKPYKAPLPRYARPLSMIAQGGVAGRFALLSAPSSPRSLALLELKSALFEALADPLSISPDASAPTLLSAAEGSGRIEPALMSALREVLYTMQRTEAAVVAGKNAAISKAALQRAGDVVRQTIDAVEAQGPLAGGGDAYRS